MATKKLPDHDEDGNNLTPPPADSDVHAIIYLLEYGRSRGFQIGPTIQVGSVIVQVADLRQAAAHSAAGRKSEPETSVWKAHGHDE